MGVPYSGIAINTPQQIEVNAGRFQRSSIVADKCYPKGAEVALDDRSELAELIAAAAKGEPTAAQVKRHHRCEDFNCLVFENRLVTLREVFIGEPLWINLAQFKARFHHHDDDVSNEASCVTCHCHGEAIVGFLDLEDDEAQQRLFPLCSDSVRTIVVGTGRFTPLSHEGIKLIHDKTSGRLSAIASREVKIGAVLATCRGFSLPFATQHTVALTRTQHLLFSGGGQYLGHSCAPNVRISLNPEDDSLTVIALRSVEENEPLTYNFLTTEWELVAPFKCHCNGGSNEAGGGCYGWIKGLKHCTAEQRVRLLEYLWARTPLLGAQGEPEEISQFAHRAPSPPRRTDMTPATATSSPSTGGEPTFTEADDVYNSETDALDDAMLNRLEHDLHEARVANSGGLNKTSSSSSTSSLNVDTPPKARTPMSGSGRSSVEDIRASIMFRPISPTMVSDIGTEEVSVLFVYANGIKLCVEQRLHQCFVPYFFPQEVVNGYVAFLCSGKPLTLLCEQFRVESPASCEASSCASGNSTVNAVASFAINSVKFVVLIRKPSHTAAPKEEGDESSLSTFSIPTAEARTPLGGSGRSSVEDICAMFRPISSTMVATPSDIGRQEISLQSVYANGVKLCVEQRLPQCFVPYFFPQEVEAGAPMNELAAFLCSGNLSNLRVEQTGELRVSPASSETNSCATSGNNSTTIASFAINSAKYVVLIRKPHSHTATPKEDDDESSLEKSWFRVRTSAYDEDQLPIGRRRPNQEGASAKVQRKSNSGN